MFLTIFKGDRYIPCCSHAVKGGPRGRINQAQIYAGVDATVNIKMDEIWRSYQPRGKFIRYFKIKAVRLLSRYCFWLSQYSMPSVGYCIIIPRAFDGTYLLA